MGALSSRQRSRLAGMAQGRECLVTLGRGGASPELVARLSELLAQHELVKLRFGDFKDSRRELAAELAERSGSELVRVIGNVAVFWKRSPDPESRRVDPDSDTRD
jgi:RNA-binding protein